MHYLTEVEEERCNEGGEEETDRNIAGEGGGRREGCGECDVKRDCNRRHFLLSHSFSRDFCQHVLVISINQYIEKLGKDKRMKD